MATGKGLAMALNIPLVGLSTLEAIARAAALGSTVDIPCLCAVLAAGRGEVYAARFELSGGEVRRLTTDSAWSPNALRADLPIDAVFAGDVTDTRQQDVGGLDGCVHLDVPLRALAIARWASTVVPPGARYQFGTPLPNYVRPSDAEAVRGRA